MILDPAHGASRVRLRSILIIIYCFTDIHTSPVIGSKTNGAEIEGVSSPLGDRKKHPFIIMNKFKYLHGQKSYKILLLVNVFILRIYILFDAIILCS